MKESKTIEELAKSFDENEAVRLSVKRSDMLRKAQKKGNETRNRKRAIEKLFK